MLVISWSPQLEDHDANYLVVEVKRQTSRRVLSRFAPVSTNSVVMLAIATDYPVAWLMNRRSLTGRLHHFDVALLSIKSERRAPGQTDTKDVNHLIPKVEIEARPPPNQRTHGYAP